MRHGKRRREERCDLMTADEISVTLGAHEQLLKSILHELKSINKMQDEVKKINENVCALKGEINLLRNEQECTNSRRDSEIAQIKKDQEEIWKVLDELQAEPKKSLTRWKTAAISAVFSLLV